MAGAKRVLREGQVLQEGPALEAYPTRPDPGEFRRSWLPLSRRGPGRRDV